MSLCFIMLNKCYDCCLSLTVYLINQRCDVFLALYHFINHVYEITRIRQTYTLLANLLLHRTFVILFPEIMSSKDAKFVSHIYLCKCVPYNDSTRTTDRAHCIWRMCVCVFGQSRPCRIWAHVTVLLRTLFLWHQWQCPAGASVLTVFSYLRSLLRIETDFTVQNRVREL